MKFNYNPLMTTAPKRKGTKASEETGGARRIFISHSGADKEFAKMLDSSLLAVGARTFIAERDIRVGDSIPERIYRGIGAATDLIYVISRHSVQSEWVQEELSIAKMRQKQSSGFRIFPLLIDDLTLPTAVLHVKYADFRAWRISAAYRASCLELLDALNVAPHVIDRNEIRWYAAHADKLNNIVWSLAEATGVLDGGLYANQTMGVARGDDQTLPDLFRPSLPQFMPTKIVFATDGFDIFNTVGTLCGLIVGDDVDVSTRLRTLRESAQKASGLVRLFDTKREYNDSVKVQKLLSALRETFYMLRQLKDEVEISLLSTTLFHRPTPPH